MHNEKIENLKPEFIEIKEISKSDLYKDCIFGDFSSSYNIIYTDMSDEHLKNFSFLSGEAIYDLACGNEAKNIIEFAHKVGCAQYVGVDVSKDNLKQSLETVEKGKNIKTQFAECDILGFLEEMKDNSGNIMINGVDDVIIEPHIANNDLYIEKIIEEIIRVIGDKYKFLGRGSNVIFDAIGEKLKKEKYLDIYIFSK